MRRRLLLGRQLRLSRSRCVRWIIDTQYHSDIRITQSAVEGTLNVLRQAVAAGIYKAVVTSSWATLLDRKCFSEAHASFMC